MLATIDLHVYESCMRVAVRVLHSCAFIEYVVFYGISLMPCNAGSGYNPTLWILQCSAIFAEACGANLVFVAHCSNFIIFKCVQVFYRQFFVCLICLLEYNYIIPHKKICVL